MADAAASAPAAPAARPDTPLAARLPDTPSAGLSSAEVAERRSRGLGNAGGEDTSCSTAEILRANILTRFAHCVGLSSAVSLGLQSCSARPPTSARTG